MQNPRWDWWSRVRSREKAGHQLHPRRFKKITVLVFPSSSFFLQEQWFSTIVLNNCSHCIQEFWFYIMKGKKMPIFFTKQKIIVHFFLTLNLSYINFAALVSSTYCCGGFPGGSDSKESACNAGYTIWSLAREDPLEKGMTNHSSILAWRIKSCRLQSLGS